MKKAILLLVISILLFPNTLQVYAANIEKGNPTATYYWDKIISSKGNEIDLKENTTLLFLNGTLITDYEIIIRNDRALVPVRLIAQELPLSAQVTTRKPLYQCASERAVQGSRKL